MMRLSQIIAGFMLGIAGLLACGQALADSLQVIAIEMRIPGKPEEVEERVWHPLGDVLRKLPGIAVINSAFSHDSFAAELEFDHEPTQDTLQLVKDMVCEFRRGSKHKTSPASVSIRPRTDPFVYMLYLRYENLTDLQCK